MKAHRWLSDVSSLVLMIAVLAAPAVAQLSVPLPDIRSFDSADVTRSIVHDEAGSGLIASPDTDKYKLLFAAAGSNIDEFGKQLNQAGEEGYRLVSVMNRRRDYLTAVAILKLDNVPHEYAWFKLKSQSYFGYPGFEQEYGPLSQRGFRLVDFLVEETCTTTTLEGDCNSGNDILFLLEREKGIEQPLRFLLARSAPQRKLVMADELTEQIKAKLADGLYPIKVLSKFDILLSEIKTEELSTGNPDVRVVTISLFRDVKPKIKELASQGYRLLLVSSGIAVMYRRADRATPISYEWLDGDDRDFENRLMALQRRGAVYRLIYPNRERTTKEKLIFELGGAVDDRQRKEYQMLRFQFQDAKDQAGNRGQLDLTPSSKEALKRMNTLAKEGFKVRELFSSKQVGVLLERSR